MAKRNTAAPLNPAKKHGRMRKAKAKLDARIRRFEQITAKFGSGGYTKPGSMKMRT